MASIQQTNHAQFLHSLSSSRSPKLHHLQNPYNNFIRPSYSSHSRKIRVFRSRYGGRGRGREYSVCCLCKSETENVSVQENEETERPPFDINLAVILAGFAFEAYTTPPDNVGKHEIDAADCKTVYLSELFLHEIYDGQLFIKLKKGIDFPAMDPWGTSDPYVVLQLNGQVVKSKVKWGTKEPTWNEDFTLNIKQPPSRNLQVAAWDANLVTPHKRMGNAAISLEDLCDGENPIYQVHYIEDIRRTSDHVGLTRSLSAFISFMSEVKYKSFDKIDEEKKWWRVPFISEFLWKKEFEAALKMLTGSETVQARQFVQYAFGQLKLFNNADIQKGLIANHEKYNTKGTEETNNSVAVSGMHAEMEGSQDISLNDTTREDESNLQEILTDNSDTNNGRASLMPIQGAEAMPSNKDFWKNFADVINKNIVQKFSVPVPEILKWDEFDLLNRTGLQSRRIADAGYVESGLATPNTRDANDEDASTGSLTISKIQSSLPDVKKATEDVLKQTDSILGALMVLTAVVSQSNKDARQEGKNEIKETKVEANISNYSKMEKPANSIDGPVLDENKAEEMKALFSTAESAMEAWAMLATSLGHPSFIKSEFEKLCFLDNASTDTQVAIWRDSAHRRLVVAFRGTEQARWKDLRTDLMLVPAGLNPERIGGDFKQEVQVHSGFLSAYDSVRTRIISLIKLSIGCLDDYVQLEHKWHVYVTGHSLGGALATLLALELSSSQLAKRGAISVSMYNFGSPRVGNKRFAEVYNEKVKDSWRVVNHRDIIPTVPRLMGYCHVAQPVYLAAGDLISALENIELLGDGYQGDVIGESTPDVIVSEFMKGEKQLIEKLLQTEINIFRSIRDGSALMQHMEDFYYITLLENVRSNYQTFPTSLADEEGSV